MMSDEWLVMIPNPVIKLVFSKIVKRSMIFLPCRRFHFLFLEGAMLALTFTQTDIDALNDLRFHHPDPIARKRCEAVYFKAKKLKTGQIRERPR